MNQFERVPESVLERLGRDTTFQRYKQQVRQRFASALKPQEKQQGREVLVVPEKTIVFWQKPPSKLRWVANVGAIRDGHRKYYGVYAGDRKILNSFAREFKPGAGRPEGSGKGYWQRYQFFLEQESLELAMLLVPQPKGRGSRSNWLRQFVLAGVEALSQGSPWTEMEVPRTKRGSLVQKLETVRVTPEQEAEIECWRNRMSDYELIKKLFTVGVAYLKDSQG